MSAATALLDAYRAGELDAADAERLAAGLGDPERGPALLGQLRFEAQLVAVLGEADAAGHERALIERLRAGGDSARFERSLRRRLPRRRSRRQRNAPLVVLAAVTALLVVPAAIWFVGRGAERVPGAVAPIADAAPVAQSVAELIAGSGVSLDGRMVRPGAAIPADRMLVVAADGHAGLRCVDGSELRIDPGSALTVSRSDGMRIFLDHGRVHAAVTPQGAGDRFELRTPQAQVAVLGTSFSVAADAAGSRIAVAEGRVAVSAIGGAQRELGPGDSCRVDAAGVITVRAAPRRVDLFDGGDASAWTPLRGDWTVIDGMLVGTGDDDRSTRIATRATFDDVEVELRVRASETVQLELQLRGYRVFWAVPGDQLGTWVTLRASAEGEYLRATIDGRPLVAELTASDVDPAFISIYARFDGPEGRVEVAEASATTTDPAPPVEEDTP